MRAGVRGVRVVAPRNELGGGRRGTANVHRGGKTGSFRVAGDISEIQQIQPVLLEAGRFLNPLDLAERRKVAVIGHNVREQLFGPGEDPIGALNGLVHLDLPSAPLRAFLDSHLGSRRIDVAVGVRRARSLALLRSALPRVTLHLRFEADPLHGGLEDVDVARPARRPDGHARRP